MKILRAQNIDSPKIREDEAKKSLRAQDFDLSKIHENKAK
jgi:hypothetical protein